VQLNAAISNSLLTRTQASTMEAANPAGSLASASQTPIQGGSLFPPPPRDIWNPIQPIGGDPVQGNKQKDVALLDQAEALAQDAYQKVSPFNSNATPASRLAAQQEMHQAQQIRNQVAQDLDPAQQQMLQRVEQEEQKSFQEASSPGNGFEGEIQRVFSLSGMVNGANDSKALDNSILGLPNPEPLPPILSWPFSIIS